LGIGLFLPGGVLKHEFSRKIAGFKRDLYDLPLFLFWPVGIPIFQTFSELSVSQSKSLKPPWSPKYAHSVQLFCVDRRQSAAK
jgi:hypothetical protein